MGTKTAENTLQVISVIEIINGNIQTPKSFIITKKEDEDKVSREAEQLFKKMAIENGALEEDFDEEIGFCNYDNTSGYEVLIVWSDMQNNI